MKKPVGIIGAGSFGTTVAVLAAENHPVVLYSRQKSVVNDINHQHQHLGYALPENIQASDNLEEIGTKCDVIFPVVPSDVFREVMQTLSPYLQPYHLLIHATKGFDLRQVDRQSDPEKVTRHDLRTMSEVIGEETRVVRTGCLSGPNLHKEIMAQQPAAAVIASQFDEVIVAGHQILNSRRFKIYGSGALLGTEIAGAIKNMIAIGTGIAGGLQMGKNVEAFLITRGLREMVIIGKSMGADPSSFMGMAGIGDLIVTGTSELSRNYSFGYKLAQGQSKDDILSEINDLVEGIRTIELMSGYARTYKLELPLLEMLYCVIFQGLPLQEAVAYLLDYPYSLDVDFM